MNAFTLHALLMRQQQSVHRVCTRQWATDGWMELFTVYGAPEMAQETLTSTNGAWLSVLTGLLNHLAAIILQLPGCSPMNIARATASVTVP